MRNRAINGGGGAIGIGSDARVVVRNKSVLTGNTAEYGTRRAPGGAIAAEENATLSISGSNVTDNMGLWGGGIYLRNDSSADISEGSIIRDNVAQDSGGGLYLEDNAVARIADSSLVHNSAANGDGGGL